MGKSDLSLEKVFSHYHDSFGVPVSPKKSSQERGKLSKMKKRKLQLSMLSLRKLFSFTQCSLRSLIYEFCLSRNVILGAVYK